ncbi:class I SAM-dependent methyltransferase, partial [Desulfotomaculum copahuensis]
QLFDDQAVDYDRWYQTPAGRLIDAIEKEAVFSYLRPQAGITVLDIGCGTGNYSLALARLGMRVTGVDISPGMLARARAKAAVAGLAVAFLPADAQKLPFPDNSFAAAISVTTLEFVPDLAAVLKEAHRVLQPGGRLVAALLGRDSAWGRYYREKASRSPDSVFNHARLYTLPELKAAMPGKNVRARSVLFIPPGFDFSRERDARELEAAGAGREDGGFICAVSE